MRSSEPLIAPRATASDDAAQVIESALAMQQASPLPFTVVDVALILELSDAWTAEGSTTRSARLRELSRRMYSAIAGVSAFDVTLCDAGDVFMASKGLKNLLPSEREASWLLAHRIVRSLDYKVVRAAVGAFVEAGAAALRAERYSVAPAGALALAEHPRNLEG